MKGIRNLQQRVSLLLWLAVSTVVLSVALGGYWFYQVVERIGTTARQQTSDLIALDESFSDAGTALAVALPLIALIAFLAALSALKSLLQESEERLRLTLKWAADAVFICAHDGRIEYVNDATINTLGYSSDELTRMTTFDLVPADWCDLYRQALARILTDEVHHVWEIRLLRKNGLKIAMELNVVQLPDGRVYGSCRDLTEHKRAEQALRQQEKHSQSLLRLSKQLELSQTYAEVLNAAQDEVKAILGYQNLWVYLFTEDKKHAKTLMAGGPISDTVLSEEGTATLAVEGDRMLEEIVEARDIVVIEDARTDERTNKENVARIGLRTVVNIPIILFDKHLGCVGTGTFGEEGVRVPTQAERGFLSAMASHLAVTLDRIHLLTERNLAEQTQQKQVQFVKALNQLAQVIAVNDQASTLLESAVKIIGEALAADRAMIYDVSFEQRQVQVLCGWLNPLHPDISSTLATYPLDVFIGGATEMLRTRQHQISHADAINPCLLEDGSAELLHQKMMIQSALWYPFDFRAQSYQALVLNQVYSRRTWSTEELAFIAAVCQQLSVALNKLEMLSKQRLAAENLRIAATAFESQQGMMITNTEGVIVRVNQAFAEITGYSAEAVIGQNPRLLSSGHHDASFYAAMWASIKGTGGWQGEIWNRRNDGNAFPEWLTISAVADEGGRVTHHVGSFSDLTTRKSAEDRIKQLAFYDSLTGLPNRQLLLDRLAQAQAASGRHQHPGALLLVDLDNFKTLNETLGSVQGDLLLTQVARCLTTCIREGDTVAHLGSDEFVVLLEDLSEDELVAGEQVQTVGQKILTKLNQIYQLGSVAYRGTASIGVTLFGGSQGESVDEPLKRAELAMYQAKTAGRNTLRFFETQMQVAVTSRAALEADLREAVFKNQFVIYYQAQVIGSGQLTGAEALVRWQHPLRGLVSPAEFIPLAEETGLIFPLGHWVLETACAQLTLWAARPEMADLQLAVNVSARQFHQKDFVDQVLAVLEHTGANPKRLKLELTESLLVDDVAGTIAKMALLKAQGVGFSLDDFGTGYSSLSYLKRLPLDQLKIDQGFVRNILTDANDAAIAKMVVALADSMGLAVIAEGVELQAQADFLAHHGCHAYQGYFFSRPVPVTDFEAYAQGILVH